MRSPPISASTSRWPVQYWRWLLGLFQGELGISVTYGKPVLGVILQRFPLTLELALLSMLIALSVGVPAGVFAATRNEQPSDLGGARRSR